jgi:hypothetical protein
MLRAARRPVLRSHVGKDADAAPEPPEPMPTAPRQHILDLRSGCDDFPEVNLRIAGRILSGLSLCLALVGCASNPRVISMGNNTYTVTREAATVFSRDTEALTAKAKEDAAKFCAAQGKQLKVVDIMVDKPFPTTGYAKAKIVFQAVDAGDSSLTSQPAPVAASERPAPVAVPERPAPITVGEKPTSSTVSERPAPVEVSEKPVAGDLYTELIKLDDLRKRGILTEEEFQAEKKKVLNRSK